MDYPNTMNAAALRYAIGVLQTQLESLEGAERRKTTPIFTTSSTSEAPRKPGRPKGRTLSPEARKAIADAQKRRWALRNAPAVSASPALPEVAEVPPAVLSAGAGGSEGLELSEVPEEPAQKRGRKKT